MNTENWSENIIIVDADYVDSVAFDLVVNFERMLNRRIPNADLGNWLDYVALDGGVKPGKNDNQVIFIHDSESTEMKMFTPGKFAEGIDGKAFDDDLGEFKLSVFPAPKDVVTVDGFVLDVLKTAANHKDVKRVMVIGNCNDGSLVSDIRQALRDVDDDKRITVFAMQPVQGGNYRTEILGYSLMAALGIKSEELR